MAVFDNYHIMKPQRGAVLNATHPLTRGLYTCLPLNEGAGTRVMDVAKHITRTLTFGANTAWTVGRWGPCIAVTGAGSLVIPDDVDTGWHGDRDITIAWLWNPDANGSGFSPMDKGAGGAGADWNNDWQGNDNIRGRYGDGTGYLLTDGGIVNDNDDKWQMHVIAYDAINDIQRFTILDYDEVTSGRSRVHEDTAALSGMTFRGRDVDVNEGEWHSFYVWHRFLAHDELLRLWPDPWCMLRAEDSPIALFAVAVAAPTRGAYILGGGVPA